METGEFNSQLLISYDYPEAIDPDDINDVEKYNRQSRTHPREKRFKLDTVNMRLLAAIEALRTLPVIDPQQDLSDIKIEDIKDERERKTSFTPQQLAAHVAGRKTQLSQLNKIVKEQTSHPLTELGYLAKLQQDACERTQQPKPEIKLDDSLITLMQELETELESEFNIGSTAEPENPQHRAVSRQLHQPLLDAVRDSEATPPENKVEAGKPQLIDLQHHTNSVLTTFTKFFLNGKKLLLVEKSHTPRGPYLSDEQIDKYVELYDLGPTPAHESLPEGFKELSETELKYVVNDLQNHAGSRDYIALAYKSPGHKLKNLPGKTNNRARSAAVYELNRANGQYENPTIIKPSEFIANITSSPTQMDPNETLTDTVMQMLMQDMYQKACGKIDNEEKLVGEENYHAAHQIFDINLSQLNFLSAAAYDLFRGAEDDGTALTEAIEEAIEQINQLCANDALPSNIKTYNSYKIRYHFSLNNIPVSVGKPNTLPGLLVGIGHRKTLGTVSQTLAVAWEIDDLAIQIAMQESGRDTLTEASNKRGYKTLFNAIRSQGTVAQNLVELSHELKILCHNPRRFLYLRKENELKILKEKIEALKLQLDPQNENFDLLSRALFIAEAQYEYLHFNSYKYIPKKYAARGQGWLSWLKYNFYPLIKYTVGTKELDQQLMAASSAQLARDPNEIAGACKSGKDRANLVMSVDFSAKLVFWKAYDHFAPQNDEEMEDYADIFVKILIDSMHAMTENSRIVQVMAIKNIKEVCHPIVVRKIMESDPQVLKNIKFAVRIGDLKLELPEKYQKEVEEALYHTGIDRSVYRVEQICTLATSTRLTYLTPAHLAEPYFNKDELTRLRNENPNIDQLIIHHVNLAAIRNIMQRAESQTVPQTPKKTRHEGGRRSSESRRTPPPFTLGHHAAHRQTVDIESQPLIPTEENVKIIKNLIKAANGNINFEYGFINWLNLSWKVLALVGALAYTLHHFFADTTGESGWINTDLGAAAVAGIDAVGLSMAVYFDDWVNEAIMKYESLLAIAKLRLNTTFQDEENQKYYLALLKHKFSYDDKVIASLTNTCCNSNCVNYFCSPFMWWKPFLSAAIASFACTWVFSVDGNVFAAQENEYWFEWANFSLAAVVAIFLAIRGIWQSIEEFSTYRNLTSSVGLLGANKCAELRQTPEEEEKHNSTAVNPMHRTE